MNITERIEGKFEPSKTDSISSNSRCNIVKIITILSEAFIFCASFRSLHLSPCCGKASNIKSYIRKALSQASSNGRFLPGSGFQSRARVRGNYWHHLQGILTMKKDRFQLYVLFLQRLKKRVPWTPASKNMTLQCEIIEDPCELMIMRAPRGQK